MSSLEKRRTNQRGYGAIFIDGNPGARERAAASELCLYLFDKISPRRTRTGRGRKKEEGTRKILLRALHSKVWPRRSLSACDCVERPRDRRLKGGLLGYNLLKDFSTLILICLAPFADFKPNNVSFVN